MTILTITFILIIHWIGDFIAQTDWEAKNKSRAWKPLLSHTITYSLITVLCWGIFFPTNWNIFRNDVGYINILFLFLITFICHTLTDYITSRIVRYYFEKGDTHNGFVVIGFDQILHYLQLFLTYKLLTNG